MPEPASELDFGRYRVQRLLGRGGMGEVYLAHDTDLERDVAIKFVSSQKLASPDARSRLYREAKAAASLDHPGICPVYEAGETPDGRAFIVMQYIPGLPLSAKLMDRGRLVAHEALELAAQIAEALGAAHRRGVVHRDLKPANVIVDGSGRARLLDFGIAKSVVPAAAAELTTAGNTAVDALIGTPHYMSPEQVQQRPLDGRSDLFALGVLLYECLTGRRPFDAPTSVEIVANVLHVHPPPVSSIRRDLTTSHDVLCARLLAKEPADRFQSTDEVVGAIRLMLQDTGRVTGPVPVPAPWLRRRRAVVTAGLAVALAAALFGVWRWAHAGRLPPVPPDADRWYRRGTESLRDGAFQTARAALERAVSLYPQHALAYARLAEADAELDDERAAQTHLLQLSQLVPDESRLPPDDQLRVTAVRSLVLRDVDASVAAYQKLVERHPDEADALVDLGQAQDAAGLLDDARASFERAIAVDHEYAAAFLQLGSVEASALRLDKALDAFGRAERLYQAASNVEGQTEVMLRRGAVLDASNDSKRARVDLERALALASASRNVSQQVRAKLTLSSVTATEGRSSEALQMATAAVAEATSAGLDAVAAGGLVDLTATLLDLHRFEDADVPIQRAIDLADHRNAKRTAARARLQLAELRRLQGRRQEALQVADSVLPFLESGHYRRLELMALLIEARANEDLGHVTEARELSTRVLHIAESLKDAGRIALAASDTAAADTQLGRYPEALGLRDRAEAIYRQQGDQVALPYTLANHADLLIRLGRPDEASRLLDELGRRHRQGLRRLQGTIAAGLAAPGIRRDDVRSGAGTPWASSQTLARQPRPPTRLRCWRQASPSTCGARLHRPARPQAPTTDEDALLVAEQAYWLGAAALIRGGWKAASDASRRGLSRLGSTPNDELRWRLSAVAGMAARDGADAEGAASHVEEARASLARLRQAFGGQAGWYIGDWIR